MTEHDLTRLTDSIIELLGIPSEDIDAVVAGVHLLPPEIADSPSRDAVTRAQAVLSLALKKLGRDYASWPADAKTAVDALHEAAFPDDTAPAVAFGWQMKLLRDRFGHVADRIEQSLPYFEIDRDASDVEVLEAVATALRSRERRAVIVTPAGLPDSAAERLRQIADEHPDATRDASMQQLYTELDALERGDTDEYEQLVAFGSGNVARDLGIPQPEAVTFKWRLARILALAMRDRNLDATAVAALAGETTPAQIDRIKKGHVRDVDSYEIIRLLKSLGYLVIVDMLPPKGGVDGHIWLSGPDDQLEDGSD